MFGTELIQIDKLIKTAQSAVSKNCAKRDFFWRRQLRNFENVKLVARFQVFWPFFWLLDSLHEVFDTQEFTRFLSTVSSQRRATRSV